MLAAGVAAGGAPVRRGHAMFKFIDSEEDVVAMTVAEKLTGADLAAMMARL